MLFLIFIYFLFYIGWSDSPAVSNGLKNSIPSAQQTCFVFSSSGCIWTELAVCTSCANQEPVRFIENLCPSSIQVVGAGKTWLPAKV